MLQIHITTSLGKQIISQLKKKKKTYSTFSSLLLDGLSLLPQALKVNEGNTLVLSAKAKRKSQAAKFNCEALWKCAALW